MWLAVLASVIVAKCVSAEWWSNVVYYRMLLDSFKDSDGDGLGDLQGATKQLSYIRAIGADAVILSPIQARNSDCSRPGTMDFTLIDPRYGNEESFKRLIEKSKKLDLKVLITLDVQRISAASEWLNHSAARSAEYEDLLIWRDGSEENPPPPEDSIDGWRWNDFRKAFWASFNNETVLNICSERLTEILSSALCTWLQRGVTGFILTPDFPRNYECSVKMVRNIVSEAVRCARAANMDSPIVLVETAFGIDNAAKYYTGDSSGVISNALISPTRKATPDLALAIHASLLYCPQDMTPVWLTSSKFGNRIATRYGSEMVDAINMISLALPGAVVIQQGDELGAADAILEWATITKCWPSQAVPSAAPFPWDNSPTAGFTSGEPWLPLAPNFRYANAKTEFENELSHAGVVRVAAAMRKSPAFGQYSEIKLIDDSIAILRWGATGSLLVIANLGRGNSHVQLTKIPGLPAEMTIAVSSGGSSLSTGAHVNVDKTLKLGPGETVLMVGPPRHCGGPGPVDKIANKLSEGWQKINKYFSNM